MGFHFYVYRVGDTTTTVCSMDKKEKFKKLAHNKNLNICKHLRKYRNAKENIKGKFRMVKKIVPKIIIRKTLRCVRISIFQTTLLHLGQRYIQTSEVFKFASRLQGVTCNSNSKSQTVYSVSVISQSTLNYIHNLK